MIAFIEGELSEIYESGVVVNCNGIGYDIALGAADLSRLPEPGTVLRIHTYLNINENTGVNLFGFLSKDDLAMFKLLITVSGIGPKGAQAILSGMSADELRFAILADDVKTISKAPGIGAKTAGKMVLELKDKISLAETFRHASEQAAETPKLSEAREEAVLALVSLGYSKTEATRAVGQVTGSDSMTSDEILSKSLRFIN